MNRSLLAKGYTFNPADGLFRKLCEWTGAGIQREVLVRDQAGRLVRVERGAGVRRFLLCAQ